MDEETQDIELEVQDDAVTDSNLRSALLLYQKKSYSQALGMLVSTFEQDKTGMQATVIGNCYQKLGSASDAMHYWRKAVSQNPTCYQAFLGLGSVAYSQNNIKQALIYWHIALSIRPEDAQINYNLATAYSRRDDRFLAIYYYEKFLKFSKSQESKDYRFVTKMIATLRSKASDLIRKGSDAVGQNNINLAVQFYVKALSNYPLHPKVVQHLAKIFVCDRNFPKAIEYYKMALKIDDKLKVCLVDIANAYVAKREYELAYAYFMRFLASYGKSGKFAEVERIASYAKSKMSASYESMKHFNAAVEHENNLRYREALDEYETFKVLSNEHAERVEESIKKLCLMIYPERELVKALIKKADEYSTNGKYEEAIALCERLLVLAVLNSQEFMWANKKRQELRYTIFRHSEGKK